jgi:predicted DNA-binding WGR domain protein
MEEKKDDYQTRFESGIEERSAHLCGCDSEQQQWVGWVLPNGELYVEYGRVGYVQKSYVYPCGSVRPAQAKLTRLVGEKLGKGYRQVAVENGVIESLDFSQLEQGKAQEIQRRLVQLQQRGGGIERSTGISFDVNRGVFMTQMGVLSPQTIAQGQRALRQVRSGLERWRISQDESVFIAAVEEYLKNIPLRVGMALDPQQILGCTQQIEEQEWALNELRLAIAEVAGIREVIRSALRHGGDRGSDERARWLQWGEMLDVGIGGDVSEPGGERACWSQWGEPR